MSDPILAIAILAYIAAGLLLVAALAWNCRVSNRVLGGSEGRGSTGGRIPLRYRLPGDGPDHPQTDRPGSGCLRTGPEHGVLRGPHGPLRRTTTNPTRRTLTLTDVLDSPAIRAL